MWITLNDAFVSVVAHRDKPDILLVRARFEGDLHRLFPEYAGQVMRTPSADYLFRVEVPRTVVALVIAEKLGAIDYPNFKNSVREHWRHDVYSRVWGVFYGAQDARRHGGRQVADDVSEYLR